MAVLPVDLPALGGAARLSCKPTGLQGCSDDQVRNVWVIYYLGVL